MVKKLHIDYLITLDACKPAIVECSNYKDIQECWNKSKRGDWMFWFLSQQTFGVLNTNEEIGSITHRKVVGAGAECLNQIRSLYDDSKFSLQLDILHSYGKGNLNKLDVLNVKQYAVYRYQNTAYASTTYFAFKAMEYSTFTSKNRLDPSPTFGIVNTLNSIKVVPNLEDQVMRNNADIIRKHIPTISIPTA